MRIKVVYIRYIFVMQIYPEHLHSKVDVVSSFDAKDPPYLHQILSKTPAPISINAVH